MSVRISGLDRVSRILAEVAPKEARNLAINTVQQVASDIAKNAAARVPIDQGVVKRAIKARRRNTHGGNKIASSVLVQRSGKGDGFYWRFLEYGQGPDGVEHAFFLKAFNDYKADRDRKYLDAFEKVLARRIQRAINRG